MKFPAFDYVSPPSLDEVVAVLEERRDMAVVLAGGYAVNTDDTVQMHCNTYRELESVIGQ